MDSCCHKELLSNGLTLLTVPMPSTQAVTVLVMIKVGSRNETSQYRGISHFLEHMPFKGTQKYPTALKLSSTVDAVGAQFNAFTGKEATGFWVKAAGKHSQLALEILSQLVFHPLLPSREIEREKGVIIQEINMYEDQPMAKVGNDFESLLYGNTPLGWETIGTKETVAAMQKQNFLDYMKKWYRPENMIVGIAGAIPSGLKTLVERYFVKPVIPDRLKAGSGIYKNDVLRHPELDSGSISRIDSGSPCRQAGMTKETKLIFSQRRPEISLRHKKTEQAHLCLGVRTFPRGHKNRYHLAVLATILGGNMSSRLFMQIRERRGLAYYVRTQAEAYLDNGYLVTQAGTDIDKAGKTIEVILKEYKKISNFKFQISKGELTRAKEFLKGRLILSLEDSQEVASFYTDDLLMEGKIRTPQEVMKAVDQVSIESVTGVAQEIFAPQNLNLAIIGPFGDNDKKGFEKIIKL
jgi:predicted Zn-dependent peptidase